MATYWAENVLRHSLGLRAGESALALVDEPLRETGEALCAAAAALGAGEAHCSVLAGPGRPLTVVPTRWVQRVSRADVIVTLLSALEPWQGSAPLRAALAAFRTSGRGRWAFGVAMDQNDLEQDLSVDFAEVVRRTSAMADRLAGARSVRIESDAGTSLTFSLDPERRVFQDSGILTEPGSMGNLPAGEAYTAPLERSAEGRLVVDLSLSDIPLPEPICLIFKGGRVADVEGGGSAAPELSRRLGRSSWAWTIGEFGIGANPYLQPRGWAPVDEKVLGTVHVALGSNTEFGGANPAAIHCDCVIRAPRLFLDGRPVELG